MRIIALENRRWSCGTCCQPALQELGSLAGRRPRKGVERSCGNPGGQFRCTGKIRGTGWRIPRGMSLTADCSLPPPSYEAHLYSGLVARNCHPLLYADPLYTHPCTINFAQFWTPCLSLGEPQIVLCVCVVFIPRVCGAEQGSTMSFQCLLAGRAGLVLSGLATPLLPNDCLELQQEMCCQAGEEVATAGCLPPRSKRREWGNYRLVCSYVSDLKLPGIKGMMRQC